jgi:hypothetical protein
MDRRFTVALRVCVSCRSPFGLGLWPWSGERFIRTHGICRGCFERLDAAFDDERPAGRDRTSPPALLAGSPSL